MVVAEIKWTTKEYDLAPDAAIPFPSNLGIMCQNVIREIEWDDVYSRENQDRFKVEAWKSDYGEPFDGLTDGKYQIRE